MADETRLRKLEGLLSALQLAVNRGEARIPAYLLGQMKTLSGSAPPHVPPLTSGHSRSGSGSRPNTPRRVENLYQAGVLKMEERHREQLTTKEQEDLQHCTFSPNIDRHSRRTNALNNERLPFWDRMGGKSGSDTVSERLGELSKKSEKLDLKGCTYHPTITRRGRAKRSDSSTQVFDRLSTVLEIPPTETETLAATKIQAIARGRITRARVEDAIERLHNDAANRDAKREQRFQELYSFPFQPDLHNYDAVLSNTLASHNSAASVTRNRAGSPSPSLGRANSCAGSDKGVHTPAKKITRSASRTSTSSSSPMKRRASSPAVATRPPPTPERTPVKTLRTRTSKPPTPTGTSTPRKKSTATPTPTPVKRSVPGSTTPVSVSRSSASPPASPIHMQSEVSSVSDLAGAPPSPIQASSVASVQEDSSFAAESHQSHSPTAESHTDPVVPVASLEAETEANEAKDAKEATERAAAQRASETAATNNLVSKEGSERDEIVTQEGADLVQDIVVPLVVSGEEVSRGAPAAEESDSRSTLTTSMRTDAERIKRGEEFARAQRLEEEREQKRKKEEEELAQQKRVQQEKEAEERRQSEAAEKQRLEAEKLAEDAQAERERRASERKQKQDEEEQKERERRAADRRKQKEEREATSPRSTRVPSSAEEDENSDDEILRMMRAGAGYQEATLSITAKLEEVEDEESSTRREITMEQNTLKREIKKSEIQSRKQGSPTSGGASAPATPTKPVSDTESAPTSPSRSSPQPVEDVPTAPTPTPEKKPMPKVESLVRTTDAIPQPMIEPATPVAKTASAQMFLKLSSSVTEALTQSHVAEHIRVNEFEYRQTFKHEEQFTTFVGMWGEGAKSVQADEFSKIWAAAESMPVDTVPATLPPVSPKHTATPISPEKTSRRESRATLNPTSRRRSSRSPSPSAHVCRNF